MTDLKKLKAGDKFFYKNVGYGLTSYELGDDIVTQKGGKLFTRTFDSYGMEWDDRRETWCFDGGLGLKCYIVGFEDEAAKRYVEAE